MTRKGKALLAAVAGLAAAAWALGTAPAATRPLTRVVIGSSTRVKSPGFSNLWIGKYLGFYEEEGIEHDVFSAEGHAQNLQLLFRNEVHLAVGAQDSVFQSAARGEHLPVKFVCSYMRGIIYQLAARPDDPAREIKDLRGRKIGVASLAHAGLLYAKTVLRDAGIDPEREAQFVAVGSGPQAGQALQRGEVDALAHWDVEYANLENLGFKFRLLPQPPSVREMYAGHTLATSEEFLRMHRDAVVRGLRALVKSIIVFNENPEAATRIHYQMYPELIPKGRPFEETIRVGTRITQVRVPLMRKEAGRVNRWCEFHPEAWRAYVKFLGLEGKVDPAQFYTNDLVADVNNFDEAKVIAQARALLIR